MILDHRRASMQLRLHLALLVPGVALPSTMPFTAGPARNQLDEVVVQELSRWLAAERRDGGAQHGNSIGALTMPLAIRSVLTLRARTETRPAIRGGTENGPTSVVSPPIRAAFGEQTWFWRMRPEHCY